jgi:hypothetical protein
MDGACGVGHSRRTVQQRHAGSPATTEGAPPVTWHPAQLPTEPVEIERADCALEGARTEKQQRLEDRMVERVQQRSGERECGPRVCTPRAKQQARAEPQHDDPDVLDRVKREQPLQVVCEQPVDDARDGRQSTDCEHEHAEPHRQDAEPFDEDADQRVDRDLAIITPLIRRTPAQEQSGACAGARRAARAIPAFVPIPTSAVSAIATCSPIRC